MHIRSKAVSMALATAFSMPAWTQQHFQNTIEQVTVTAQRRAQSAQEVPLAVSAFSADDLERRNLTEALDLVRAVPNLIGNQNQGIGAANSFYLRGLGTSDSIATIDPAVGTYVDDIYLSRQNANNVALFDIERVEVLRGPQGTLFGRNTTGGAVSVITRKPGDTFGGYAEAGVSNYGGKLVRASVDLPASERLSAKLSGYWLESDGYVDNTTTGEKLQDEESHGLRAAIQAHFAERVTWDLSIARTETTAANLLNFDCDPGNPSRCDGRFVTTGLRANPGAGGSQFPGVAIAGSKANYPMGAQTDTTLAASSLKIELGGAQLELITGQLRIDQEYMLDFTDGRGSPSIAYGLTPSGQVAPTTIVGEPPVARRATGGFVLINDAVHKQFSQEVKLTGQLFGGRLEYVSGLFYLKEENDTDFADLLTLAASGTTLLLADRTLDNEARNAAAYVQADYRVTDRLTATAGVRYTDEEKRLSIRDNRPQALTPNPAARLDTENLVSLGIPVLLQDRAWTPRVVLKYDVSEDMNVFGSATRGTRSGGWSARASSPATLLPFGPENVWSYELGSKSEWLNRRLRLNVTAFYQETEDFQVPTSYPNAAGALTFVTGNFATFENTGVEIEVQAIPLAGLNVYANIGVQDGKYVVEGDGPVSDQLARCNAGLSNLPDPVDATDLRTAAQRAQAFCGNGIVTTLGTISDPTRLPTLSASAGIAYEWTLGTSLRLIPSIDVIYTDDYETGLANVNIFEAADGSLNTSGGSFVTGSRAQSRTLVNAGVQIASADHWQASLYCKNCLDKTYVDSTTANYSYLGEPRTYGLTLRYEF